MSVPGAREIGRPRYAGTLELRRRDLLVRTDGHIEIFIREVTSLDVPGSAVPVLLVHGARAGSVASFDLDVEHGSLAADLACHGHPVYLLDVRGYGSARGLAALDQPAESNPPLARSEDAVLDISAAVSFITETGDFDRVAAMGWATGSQWLAHFAAEFPDRLSHLVLYNAVWPVRGAWPIGDGMADPGDSDCLREGALAAYGYATAEALLARWDASIPVADPDEWREPRVVAEYLAAALAGDPTSGDRQPPSFRVPLGPLADTFEFSRGKARFDPARITARVLILRSELDFWSRDVDFDGPVRDLTSAQSVERILLSGATHYAHLDRPERGRAALLEAVTQFFAGS